MKAINLLPNESESYRPASIANLVFNPSQPAPIPNASQALVKVHATAITPYELTWPTPAGSEPRIPCHDVAGTIVSSPSPFFSPGDRVFGLFPSLLQGGLADYVAVEPQYLALIPESLSFVEASSVPRAALTCWQAFKDQEGGLIKRGMRVLVTGASGAVGKMAVQILRVLLGEDGKIVALGGVGSDGLKDLGANVVFNYREKRDWEKYIGEDGLFDVVYDCVGGETIARCLPLVKDGGRVVTVASPPPAWESINGWDKAERRGVKGLFFIVVEEGEQLREIARLLDARKLRPSVGLVVNGLSEEGVRAGWQKGLKGGVAGSVVVNIS